MKEIQKIVSLYQQLDFTRQKAALATVIAVEGSSYRREGAKMLITDDGRWEGSISGGCLEGDALRKARQVMASGIPVVVTYDTMEDGAGTLGIGLGCNGIIHIFIEPINHKDNRNPIEVLADFIKHRDIRVVATVIQDLGGGIAPGKRFDLVSGKKSEVPPWLEGEMQALLETGRPFVKTLQAPEGDLSVFIERIDPGISLLICGAGYDAAPLASLACDMGWQVTITEDCIAHLAPRRFPAACQLVFADRQEVLEKAPVGSRTAVVLLSHNYKYDMAVLERLLGTAVRYIGILGPAKRFEKMRLEMEDRGIHFTAAQLQRIHAPAGLDIGAETPEEIALAIVSEIKAVFASRSSGFLKERQGPIHERVPATFIPATTIQHVA